MSEMVLRSPAQVGVVPPPPLSLYVHLPWCLRKCPYCDFNSHAIDKGSSPGVSQTLDAATEAAYLEALQRDLESALPQVWGRTVQTVFIGGGTPSLFSASAIDRLLVMVRSLLRLSADAEVTLEANPGTFEADKFSGFRDAGVNRLSIGVQSFNDSHLKALGRVHDSGQAKAAIDLAARVFPTFNIDLMYGLPGQSLDDLELDLATALAMAPPHLSYYNLTLEPNTYFASHPPELPDEDTIAAMQDLIELRAAAMGLRHYEVSAYARDGHRCRHNLNYWQFGDYLGIGAGAHGKLSFFDGVVRHSRYRHPRKYQEQALAGNAVEETRRLAAADLGFEFMLNALRLIDGVPSGLYEERTGQSLGRLAKPLAEAEKMGLLVTDPTVIRATPQGQRFLNDLQALFLA